MLHTPAYICRQSVMTSLHFTSQVRDAFTRSVCCTVSHTRAPWIFDIKYTPWIHVTYMKYILHTTVFVCRQAVMPLLHVCWFHSCLELIINDTIFSFLFCKKEKKKLWREHWDLQSNRLRSSLVPQLSSTDR